VWKAWAWNIMACGNTGTIEKNNVHQKLLLLLTIS